MTTTRRAKLQQEEDLEDQLSEEIIEVSTSVEEATIRNKQVNIQKFDFLTIPQTKSFTHFSKVPEPCRKEEVILGVDEAGRGPVLGPMVYAVCFIPKSKDAELKGMGVDDSKGLNAERRSELFSVIQKTEWIGWGIHACSAQDISESMLRRAKYNLNALAHDTTINLIKSALEQQVNLKEVYIDTVGDPDKYRIKLEAIFPKLQIVVAKKADSLYPSVSAASICAKVLRDEMMENWNYIENGLNEKLGNTAFGSGYPSDPNTVAWINKSIDFIFGFPRLVRFSWSTASKLLEVNAASVTWFSDEEEEDIRKFFSRKRKLDDEEDNDDNIKNAVAKVIDIPREAVLMDLIGLEIMTLF